MNATTPPLDLDARIRLAEQAVIERDQRVHDNLRAGLQRVRQHALRGAVMGIGVLAIGVALWRATRRTPRPGLARARLAGAAVLAARRPPRALMRLAALLWPLLPTTLRQRVGQRALSLVSLGFPALAGLQAARHEGEGPVRAVDVDLSRYAGRWHEIARLPIKTEDACARDVSASYALRDGGMSVVNRCVREDGRIAQVQGRARRANGDDASQLEITFAPSWLRWLPLVWDDYWILDIDADYHHAVVGSPDRRHLWLLARSPTPDAAQLRRMVQHARAKGYAVDELILTAQSALPVPLH